MNPTEKGFTGRGAQATGHDGEPAWVADPQVAVIDLDTSDPERLPLMIAAICEGEENHCEFFGEKFPLWPSWRWADHILLEHGAALTMPVRQQYSYLNVREITSQQQVIFSTNFISRIAMRRRAWQLGYTVVKPGAVTLHD